MRNKFEIDEVNCQLGQDEGGFVTISIAARQIGEIGKALRRSEDNATRWLGLRLITVGNMIYDDDGAIVGLNLDIADTVVTRDGTTYEYDEAA